MIHSLRLFFISCCILFSSSLFANTTSQKIDIKDTVTAPNSDKALIAFNVGVDLSSIEQPATIAAESIEKLASSLQTMAEHPNLTPSQQQTVIETFQQIDTLAKHLINLSPLYHKPLHRQVNRLLLHLKL
ncbi:hypothetical protein UA32_07495 [Photobacterium angustum]|uniref:Uncharacterized protein n=1 Tax=Photobacterium angustum TaxID=661 RepID=A0ABX5H1F8_PHOAN|nr:hypothetical protein [Photobacterium angustum]KJG39079.1 hypothetical protein UA32_07495 [Photobacterium angustum]PSX07433.1 hypothetical protein C0W27_15530 [Photobacterium angustum]